MDKRNGEKKYESRFKHPNHRVHLRGNMTLCGIALKMIRAWKRWKMLFTLVICAFFSVYHKHYYISVCVLFLCVWICANSMFVFMSISENRTNVCKEYDWKFMRFESNFLGSSQYFALAAYYFPFLNVVCVVHHCFRDRTNCIWTLSNRTWRWCTMYTRSQTT